MRIDKKEAAKHRALFAQVPIERLAEVVDAVFGVGAYAKLLTAVDAEVLKQRMMRRRGTTDEALCEALRRQELEVVDEAERAKRYKSTKRGQLETRYMLLIHTWRTKDRLSWPRIEKQLRYEFKFKCSQRTIIAAYSDWLKNAQQCVDKIKEAPKCDTLEV